MKAWIADWYERGWDAMADGQRPALRSYVAHYLARVFNVNIYGV